MRLIPSPRRLPATAALIGLLALSATACATDDTAATDTAATDSAHTIVVDDMAYSPAAVTVPAGTTVTWAFEDGMGHDIVGDGFESDMLTDATFSHTFTEPGTYEYLCSLHPNMTGKVKVTA